MEQYLGKSVVYMITNPILGLKYIGSRKEWKGLHTYYGSPSAKIGHNKYEIQQLWLRDSKEFPENFTFEILECLDYYDAITLNELEKFYQKKFNAVKINDFINAAYADPKWRHNSHTDSTKQKISQSSIGRKQSPEWIEKRVSQIRGDLNGMSKGHSDESKLAITNSLKKTWNENDRNQIRSEKYKGSGNPRAKKVSYNGIIYSCAKDLVDIIDAPYTTITRWINDSRKPEIFYV